MTERNHIVVDPALNFEDERLCSILAQHAVPGETVRLSPTVKFRGEADGARDGRVATFGDRILTVAELKLDKDDDGAALNYRFEGVEGLHPARAFTNPEGYEHFYGVLIQRDGQAWLVPFDVDHKAPETTRTVQEPKRISNETSRCGNYFFGLPDPVLDAYGRNGASGSTLEGFLAEQDATPSEGEFDLSPMPDGTWRLDASGWMSTAEPDLVALADEAVGAIAHAPSPR